MFLVSTLRTRCQAIDVEDFSSMIFFLQVLLVLCSTFKVGPFKVNFCVKDDV